MFKLPYEKFKSVSEEIREKRSIPRFVVGYVFFEKIGALLIGKKKQKGVCLVVNGQDKNEYTVKIRIVFSQVNRASKAIFMINQKIGKARGITI